MKHRHLVPGALLVLSLAACDTAEQPQDTKGAPAPAKTDPGLPAVNAQAQAPTTAPAPKAAPAPRLDLSLPQVTEEDELSTTSADTNRHLPELINQASREKGLEIDAGVKIDRNAPLLDPGTHGAEVQLKSRF